MEEIGVKYRVIISSMRTSMDSDYFDIGLRYALQCQVNKIFENIGYNISDFDMYTSFCIKENSHYAELSMFFYVKNLSEAIYHKMNGFVIEESIEEQVD